MRLSIDKPYFKLITLEFGRETLTWMFGNSNYFTIVVLVAIQFRVWTSRHRVNELLELHTINPSLNTLPFPYLSKDTS